MAINKHDDYEALARLLYPSIEASGNVYYGQTRKLTLDEVLKRNSLGFDSHIESFYNDYHGYYDSYFCWRLGSLHGSIRVDPFVDSVTIDNFSVDFIKRILYADSEEIIYDDNLIYKSSQADPDEDYTLDTSTIPIFGTIFAKYRLDKHSTTVTNELNSGSYDSYEIDVEPVLDGLYVTDDFNPVNSIDDDISERHFYISKENGIDYLYVQILTSKDTSKILTFTALEESEISLSMGQPSDGFRVVEYRVSQGGVFPDIWETYHYDWIAPAAAPTGPISLSSGQRIQFRSDIADATLFNSIDDCLKFVVDSGKVFVSGSCMSMCHPDIDESTVNRLEDYALYGLFSGIENMYGTPILPNVRKLGIRCYEKMFYACTSLTVAPKIPLSDVDGIENDTSYCYYNMFAGCTGLFSPPKMIGEHSYNHSGWGYYAMMFLGCTNLRYSPVIHHSTLDYQACFMMFNGCSSLKLVQCAAKNLGESSDRTTYYWLSGVPRNGVFIKSSANYSSGTSGIPSSWTVVTKDDEYFVIHEDPETGFRIDKHTPSNNYKNDYLVTSGTDSETNGRGYINNYVATIGKMERSFDENKTHKMNTYNQDGSFNQEIWGYKTFNSPVKFRNGLYGEDWSIYTFDYDISDFRVNKKSTVISRDTSESASIQIYSGYDYLSGSTNSVILSTEQPRSSYDTDENIATIEVSSTKGQYTSASSITMTADDIQLIGDYGCTYHEYDKDITLSVPEITCDGGIDHPVNARDRTITISSDVNYEEDNYSKAFITTSSKISEPIVRVIPSADDDIRVENSSIDLRIYTTSSDIPASSISLASQKNPYYNGSDSLMETDRSNTIRLKVTDDSSSHNAGTITLDSGMDNLGATITIASNSLHITDVDGHYPMIECNRSNTTIRNKLLLDQDPFSGVSADDDDKRFGFNFFNVSIIAIKLASSGNYFVCPNDTIKYQRSYRHNNQTITFSKAYPNHTVSISGLTRITSSSDISDIYLAIMTPSGYNTTEFRLAGICTFRILSFGRSESSQYIYVLAAMQNS